MNKATSIKNRHKNFFSSKKKENKIDLATVKIVSIEFWQWNYNMDLILLKIFTHFIFVK